MNDDSPVKAYHVKQLEIKQYNCLICGNRAGKDGLRSPKEQGIVTFINSLRLRNECNGFRKECYSEYIDFEKNCWKGDRSLVKWHPKCYASYCSSKNIAHITAITSSSTNSTKDHQGPKTRASEPLINLREFCLFCGMKKCRGNSKLVVLQYQDVIDKIRKRCIEKNDKNFERRIGVDFDNLPAFDAKYHTYCLGNYIKDDNIDRSSEVSLHDVCFTTLLADYVDPSLTEGRALSMNDLLRRYKVILKDNNYEMFDSYTTQKLKQKFQKHFGNDIAFSNNAGKKQKDQFVYLSTVSIPDVINMAANYKKQLKDRELIENAENFSNEQKILEESANILCNDIRDVDGVEIHPLDPTEITLDAVKDKVPKNLLYFLGRLCGKNNDKKVLSIAQDIITQNSNGKKRMPKNIGLGLSLKRSVKSKEFVTLLNNLGHCISYDDVLRIETTWANAVMENDDGYATIPSNIVNGYFTQAASDNGDYGQDNNSQHVTNTVLYQYNAPLNGRFTNFLPNAKKTLRRSISAPQPDLVELEANLKPKLPKYLSDSKIRKYFESHHQSNSRKESTSLTTSWILLRMTGNKLFKVEASDQKIPNWTGLRKLVSIKVSTPTTIGNCRTIPASPTDLNVVHTMLLNVKKILTNTGQPEICVTLDEAIYQLGKQIQWQVPFLEDIVLRLGGFHRAKNFMGVIGKRMRMTGFEEVLEKAGVYGPNQIEGILKAKHYNRATNAHKTMLEALMRLFWAEFAKWLEREGHDYRVEFLHNCLEETCTEFETDEFDKPRLQEKVKAIQTELLTLEPLLEHFRLIGIAQSDTFKFWYEYCEMVYLVLDFIAAERQSDWLLHLETFREMLYYDKAFDHYKYFTWGIIYLCDMERLPEQHPYLYENFINGSHTVSRAKSTSTFNTVSTDMALEQSLNKDSKSKGGIIGVTQDANAVEKWTLTAHLYASVISNFKQLCGVNQFEEDKSLSIQAAKKTDKAVLKIIEVFEESSNPFEIPTDKKVPLKNIVSGHIINSKNTHDVLEAKSIGKSETLKYVDERLIEQKTNFWDTFRKLNLSTFSSDVKPVRLEKKKNEQPRTLKYHQGFLSRLLTASQSREIDLQNILTYELAPVPLALFHLTGEMRKTNKSQLLKELEVNATNKEVLELTPRERSISIIDFMALIQSINKTGLKTFGDLSKRLMLSIKNSFKESDIVALVPDRYDFEDSIKLDERNRRQKTTSAEIDIVNDNQVLPDLTKLLQNSANKSNLVAFLFQAWKTEFIVCQNQQLFLADIDGSTTKVSCDGYEKVNLVCDHEEADTKMFAYLDFIVKSRGSTIDRVIIHSPDTDVFIISCYHYVTTFQDMGQFWFKTGTGKQKRYVAVHETTKEIGNDISAILPAFHAMTGCDTVSSISGIGKKSAFKALKNSFHQLADLIQFGSSPSLDLSHEAVVAAIRFMCLLYDKSDVVNINYLRYKLFTKKNILGDKLPPTLDALTLHLQRANYQCYIWKSACCQMLNLPTCIGNGWTRNEDNVITQELMIRDAAPAIIVELTQCKCKKGCKTNSCSCRKAGMKCTEGCGCQEEDVTCENYDNENDSSDEDDEDDEDDENC